jgi:RNA polymerase sigma factor (sigma-70 family)
VADPLARALNRLGRVVGEAVESLSDADLLRRYVATRDGEAFAVIVRRYGPMVFGVCRRVLGHVQDAEDAFQATFLVLARKARSIRAAGLSRWLYGVAVRVANKARAQRAGRLARQAQLRCVAEPTVNAAEPTDWLPLLDSALGKLSTRDRLPILLCDLRGMSRTEAAAALGIAEGTLSSRLARARDKLRTKLARLGPVLSLPALTAGLADRATATVPNSLIESTVAAAAPAARELAEGVLRNMFLVKLMKLSVVGACAVGAIGIGVAWLPTNVDRQAPGKAPAWPVLAAAPPQKAPTSERLRELQRERVKALEEQLKGQFDRTKIGKDPLIELIDAIRELGDAKLDLVETRDEKLKVLDEKVKMLKEVEEQIVALQNAGLQTSQGVAQIKAARIKAEIEQEKLKLEK